MALIDVLIIVIYLLGLVAVGVYASRNISTGEDYALAGKSLSRPVLTGTLVGSTIGAAATMGKAGKAYEAGYLVLFASLAYFFGYLCMAFLGPKLRAAQITSLPDVLRRRYGNTMQLTAAAIVFVTVLGVFGAQLIACGLIAESLFSDVFSGTGLGYEVAVLIAALVIVLYTLFGGLLAVAYTDLIQVLIMLVGIGLLLPALLALDLGSSEQGWQVLHFSVPEASQVKMDWGYIASFFPIYMAFVLIDAGTWQRIAAAKDADSVRPAMLTTAAIYALWSVLVVALGVVALNILPQLSSPDAAIPELILAQMPVVVKGLCLAAIIAIIMSTADTALLIAGTTISRDVIQVVRPQTSEQSSLAISRWVILIAGVLGTIFALGKSSLFELNLILLAVFVSGLFIPIMAALFLPAVSSSAALVSALAGVIVTAGLYILKTFGVFDSGVEPILLGLSASALALGFVRQLAPIESESSRPLIVPTH